MAKSITVQEFFTQFPDDDSCLAHLFKQRYGDDPACGRCGEVGKFRKLSRMPAYTCNCGHHIHPMVGTPFGRTRVPLQKWFYAMYLFTTSRHGVPAKELQRQLGVSYETAWEMARKIRKYLGKVDGDGPLSGHVEVDETYIGGRRSGGKRGRGASGKTIVMGMVQRQGDVLTRVIANVQRATLEAHILENVRKGSTVSTDEFNSYAKLSRHGYDHGLVHHSSDEWVNGVHHTNSVEGFWSLVKRSIRGAHVHVSRKHLATYLGEFEFRWNSRHAPEMMFPRLLLSF